MTAKFSSRLDWLQKNQAGVEIPRLDVVSGILKKPAFYLKLSQKL
jgi:hypothetical protein